MSVGEEEKKREGKKKVKSVQMKPSNMYLRTRNEDDDHGDEQKK